MFKILAREPTIVFDEYIPFLCPIKVTIIQTIASLIDCPVDTISRGQGNRYIFISAIKDTVTSIAIHLPYDEKIQFFKLLEEIVLEEK